MAHGGKGAVGGEHAHEVALIGLAVDVVYGPGEHPGMVAAQGVFLAALEMYGCHGCGGVMRQKSRVVSRRLISS